ncbi:hypothetical protein CH267_00760 [Rhodococcus sp. 06-621-2]|nr:hypothetical protein [Rhodococcus sp. 06-621-2]OZC62105.1 hypothetical protein CH267_00760 [Rhodococcus sp. 06-621-2]
MTERAQRWDAPQKRTVIAVPGGITLTHLGRKRADGTYVFDDEPKWRSISYDPFVEVDVSMMEGRLSVEEAWRKRRRMTAPAKERRRQAARYFLSDDLWANSYFVFRTPSAYIPEHVSVYADMRYIEEHCPSGQSTMVFEATHHTWWTSTERVRLSVIAFDQKGAADE